MSQIKQIPILRNIVTGDINKNDRDGVFHRVWGYVVTNKIHGDYLEFGVYEGDTISSSYSQYCIFRKWMRGELDSNEHWRGDQVRSFYKAHPVFYGFDSFEGIPENFEDATVFHKGTYAMSKDGIIKKLLKGDVDLSHIRLIKSYFSDLDCGVIPKKVSVIHIDSDLYESAKVALELCHHSIQQGTVVLFDDYNCFCSDNNKGERKALLEFSKKTGIQFESWFSYKYVGKAFICHMPI